MRDITKHCLEKLENTLDEDYIQKTRKLQKQAFSFAEVDHIPTVIHYNIPETEWPSYDFEEIFYDREKMLLHELKSVYTSAKIKDDSLYGIRANYGTGIIASIFGCPLHTFKDSLPVATKAGDLSQVKEIMTAGVPDIYQGIAGKALDTVAYFRDVLHDYPRLSRNIRSQVLDIQGTFDNASIIWGSDIFYGVIDHPQLVQDLIRIVTQVIEELVIEHRKIDDNEIREHAGAWEHLGGICLRNDSCVNLSGDMYKRFVKPFDRELLNKFTGWIHFCGEAHQWWPDLLDIEGLKGINPYQGEFYQLGNMYPICQEKQIPIVQWTVPVSEKNKEMITTGFSRITFAESLSDARKIRDRVLKTGWPT